MYSKGISWINDCRIPFIDEGEKEESYRKPLDTIREGFVKTTKPEYKSQGRFPANILVSDDMLNDGSIGKSNDHKWKGEDTSPIYGKYENRTRTQVYSDKGSNSRYYDIDKWFENLIDV